MLRRALQGHPRRVRRRHRPPAMCLSAGSMWVCLPDLVRERFFQVRVSRSLVVSSRAAQFCQVRRGRTFRCLSGPCT